MRDDFCAVILTHGRPDNVITLPTLRKHGYTGDVVLMVDDEDETLPEYKERYGDQVYVFSKDEAAKKFDEGINAPRHRGVVYARAAVWDAMRDLGYPYFIQLDDDYDYWGYRFRPDQTYHGSLAYDLDTIFEATLEFFINSAFMTVTYAQGGDFIGGSESNTAQTIGTKRKAMNTFFCSLDREFYFPGARNEDVNAYVQLQRRGLPFITLFAISINQAPTQANPGGMTDAYLDEGTYIKSFYSVMRAPSCVTVFPLTDGHGSNAPRLHHRVDWNATAPKIVRETHKK